MLTIKQLREDPQAAIRKLAKKGVDAAPVIAKIEKLDDRRKAIQVELDNTLATQNKAAKEIGMLMSQGRREEAEERKSFVAGLKEQSARLNTEAKEVAEELQAAIVSLPNFPPTSSPRDARRPTTWWSSSSRATPSCPRMHCPTGSWPASTTSSTSTWA